MSVLQNIQHPLVLLVLAIIIQTSWTVNMKATEDLLRDIYLPNGSNLNNRVGVNHINPSLSNSVLHNSKQFDERLSNIIANNVLNFGHNIGLQLAAQDAYNTEIFSPLSVMAALSLLMLGAKGTSYQELKQLNGLDSDIEFYNNPSKFHEELGLLLSDLQHLNETNKRQNALWRNTHVKSAPSRSTNRPQVPVDHVIKVANGLFVQSGYELNPDYKQIIKSIYDSELTQLDFQSQTSEARNYINSWVNKSTFGKIPQIINGQIEKSTNVILASVLYFKAFWLNPFFSRSTKEENFYPDGLNSPPIRTPMMPTGGIFPFYDAKEYDCRIIGLPYKGNETTMYVIQPNDSSRQRLRELQRTLNGSIINEMIDKMERKTTIMVFPKMHFTRSMTMKTILKNLNIQSIFESSYSDLSLLGGRTPTTNSVATAAKFTPSNPAVTFASIYRNPPTQPRSQQMDLHQGLVFTARFGDMNQSSYDIRSENSENVGNKTTEFAYPGSSQSESQSRHKRQVPNFYRDPTVEALANIESDRLKLDQYRSDLYVDDIIHKVDFAVDEYGTEAAAATLTYLTRSGTDVVFRGDTPFLIVIRHDPTKLPLFYGIINKPE